jgi:hypothetical protein
MPMRVQHVDPLAVTAEVEALWRPLAESASAPYFLSWPWVENWLALLPRDVWLRLLAVFEDQHIVAACFVGRRDVKRARVIPSRALYLNATGHPELDSILIEHNRWLVRPSHRLPLSQLLGYLPHGWDELFLDAVDEDALGGPIAFESGSRLRPRKTMPCPIVELHKVREAGGEYLPLLSAQTRSQIRRSLRRYAEAGPVTSEIATSLDQAKAFFDELLELHAQAWRARGKEGAFTQPFVRRFHDRLIRERFPHGEIQMIRTRAGRTTIGCLYNFVWNGTVSYYQSGLLYSDDNRLKPGLVCHTEAVRVNARLGHSVYDLLGGASRYKRSLATRIGSLHWATIQRRRPQFIVEDGLRALRERYRSLRREVEEAADVSAE